MILRYWQELVCGQSQSSQSALAAPSLTESWYNFVVIQLRIKTDIPRCQLILSTQSPSSWPATARPGLTRPAWSALPMCRQDADRSNRAEKTAVEHWTCSNFYKLPAALWDQAVLSKQKKLWPSIENHQLFYWQPAQQDCSQHSYSSQYKYYNHLSSIFFLEKHCTLLPF